MDKPRLIEEGGKAAGIVLPYTFTALDPYAARHAPHCWHTTGWAEGAEGRGEERQVCCFCGGHRTFVYFLANDTHGPHAPAEDWALHRAPQPYYVYDDDLSRDACAGRPIPKGE